MFNAIINQPGYLPEAEPVTFDTCAEAWSYLADEIENDWLNDDSFDGSFVEKHRRNKAWSDVWKSALAERVPGGRVAPNGYVYSVDNAEEEI